MHELSLCRSILQVVERAAGDQRVNAVNLQVGRLRQVVPGTLAYCWGLVTDGGPLAGSSLQIESVPVAAVCRDCGAETEIEQVLLLVCGRCGGGAMDVVRGEEFLITTLDLDDRAAS